MLVPWLPETFQARSNMTEMLLIGFSLTFQVKNRKYKGGRQALRRTGHTKLTLVLTKLLRVHTNKKPNHWLFNFSTSYFWNYNIATTWLSATLVNSPVVFIFFDNWYLILQITPALSTESTLRLLYLHGLLRLPNFNNEQINRGERNEKRDCESAGKKLYATSGAQICLNPNFLLVIVLSL